MSDYLFLLSELAVAFAGFTAIVNALDRRPLNERRTLDVERLRQMMEVSLVTIAAALFPALLDLLGLRPEAVWRFAGGVMALVMVVIIIFQTKRGFRRSLRQEPGYNLTYARFLLVIGLGIPLSFTAAALGLGEVEGFYATGVTLSLTVAGLQFFRASTSFLVERAKRDRPGGDEPV